jgi:hypothetical protein
VTGKFEVSDTLEATTLTLSYVLRFCEEVEPTVMRPLFNSNFCTENAPPDVAEDAVDVAAGAGA